LPVYRRQTVDVTQLGLGLGGVGVVPSRCSVLTVDRFLVVRLCSARGQHFIRQYVADVPCLLYINRLRQRGRRKYTEAPRRTHASPKICYLQQKILIFLSPPSERSEWRKHCFRLMSVWCVCLSVCAAVRSIRPV